MVTLDGTQKSRNKSYSDVPLITTLKEELLNDMTPMIIRIQLFMHRHFNDISDKEIKKFLTLQTDLFHLGDFIKNIDK